ncbi:MAG: metal-dependent hydrolase, partial [Candidatus Aminicenantes bacterium]|nr:metal-dependent hydrolase [Candidatus Aminicenantes bacterium]
MVILITAAILFSGSLVVAVFFYFWASSGTLAPEHLSEILTYSKPGVSEGNSKEVFRIMSYNIGYLSGMSNSLPLREDKDFFDNNKK